MDSILSKSHAIDIFLQPGEFYFGDRETRLRTILGSCVAITLWHPRLRIGGMCHYLLPMRRGHHDEAELDGRYADDSLTLRLIKVALSAGHGEVLATSLTDAQAFPAAELAELYHARWNIEEAFKQNLQRQFACASHADRSREADAPPREFLENAIVPLAHCLDDVQPAL